MHGTLNKLLTALTSPANTGTLLSSGNIYQAVVGLLRESAAVIACMAGTQNMLSTAKAR